MESLLILHPHSGEWWRIWCPRVRGLRSRGFWERPPLTSVWTCMQRDEDQALLKYNPEVVSYVTGMEQPDSRAQSRRSGWSRPSSGVRASDERPLSSLSMDSSIREELEELKDKLKVSDIDEVVLHLQSLFHEECRTLEKHIAVLQQCLEEDYLDVEDAQTPLTEPSLTELKEERRTIERDLQLDQLPATPVQTSKMASTRLTKPIRSLDHGRRCSSGDQGSRLSQKIPVSSGLHQYKASLAPCPPDPKLRVPDNGKINKFSAVLGSPCSTLPRSLMKSPAALPGPEAAHKPMNLSGLERISHNPGQGPASKSSVLNVLPAQSGQLSADTVFLPIPPSLQRPTSRTSAPSFRRVRTQLPS
ncbi:coiled-coil domain-containing protein 24 isoform X2 [Pseudophryne corroboree]|uniref:coiled-coil domain-containing protein 24 isoform X2 n=1 Tax=Pseudophryne corroboree TaxID=495146 RepID=UPI0030815399